MRRLLAACIVFSLSSAAWAESVVFDFESVAEGHYTELVMTKVTAAATYTVKVTRGPVGFDIVNLSPWAVPGGVPTTWGARTLSPFNNFADPTQFTFEITVLSSTPTIFGVQQTSISFGDFSPSDIDYVAFTDGVNALMDNQFPSPGMFFMSSGIGSINQSLGQAGETTGFARGGSDNQRMSLFWDNFTLLSVPIEDFPTNVVAPALSDQSDPLFGPGGIPAGPPPVPEPATLLLIGSAVGALALRARRRS